MADGDGAPGATSIRERWRCPGRRIWRAFPELDPFTDEQCRRFMKVACRRSRWRHLHRLLVAAAAVALLAVVLAVLSWWMILRPAVHRISSPLDDLPFGLLAAIGGCALLVPPLGTLVVRDRLLRRRLREALRGTGACPQCRYALVGLMVPESLEFPCPECGFLCRVDRSLTERARDSSGDAGGRVIVFHAAPFWTRERRRRWLRNGLIAVGSIVLLLGTPAGINEWRIRRQAAQANAARPSASEIAETLRRHRREDQLVAALPFAARLERLAARIKEIHALEMPEIFDNSTGSGGSWFVDTTMILPDEPHLVARVESDGGEAPEDIGAEPGAAPSDIQLAALARRMFNAYERHGFMAEVDEITSMPVLVQDVAVPPSMLTGLRLPWLAAARELARLHRARVLLAAQRGDLGEAARALDSLLALAQHVEAQPFLIEFLVAEALRALADGAIRRWLASSPTEVELDAIERVLDERGARPEPGLALELELVMLREFSADFFGNPSNVRLAAILPHLAVQALQAPLALPGTAPPASIGTWEANERAIEQWRAYALQAIVTEPHQRRGTALAAPPPIPTDAGMAQLSYLFRRGPQLEQIDAALARDRSIRLWIALERWRLRHGSYPEHLGELVPEMLPALPVDPYSGAPFCYRRVDPSGDPIGRPFHLWATGPDGVDDGGRDLFVEGEINRAVLPLAAKVGTDCMMNSAMPIPGRGAARPTPAATTTPGSPPTSAPVLVR